MLTSVLDAPHGLSVIVPLAGPDCYLDDQRIRPLIPCGDVLPAGPDAAQPLIHYVLRNRFWRSQPHQLIFVIRHQPPQSQQLHDYLVQTFPGCAVNVVANVTQGAVFSVLAGLAQITQPAWPVVFDLADIAFEWAFDACTYFQDDPLKQGVIPWFTSNNPKFSYLRCEGQLLLEAREKLVVSDRASAGVYVVRNLASALTMLRYGVRHPEQVTVRNAYFLCPCMNGLTAIGDGVDALPVAAVQAFSAVL